MSLTETKTKTKIIYKMKMK